VVNRLSPQRTAFIAGIIILATCGVGRQTPLLRDLSARQEPLSPLSATDPIVHKGLFTMVFSLYSYFETMINDVTFGGYHKFGSEARILPGFEETEEPKAPAAPAKPH
jgi:hypothetical protein